MTKPIWAIILMAKGPYRRSKTITTRLEEFEYNEKNLAEARLEELKNTMTLASNESICLVYTSKAIDGYTNTYRYTGYAYNR